MQFFYVLLCHRFNLLGFFFIHSFLFMWYVCLLLYSFLLVNVIYIGMMERNKSQFKLIKATQTHPFKCMQYIYIVSINFRCLLFVANIWFGYFLFYIHFKQCHSIINPISQVYSGVVFFFLFCFPFRGFLFQPYVSICMLRLYGGQIYGNLYRNGSII